MKKHFILAVLSLFLFSCLDINYEGSERSVFEGRIVEENGNPLSGITVRAIATLSPNHTLGNGDYDVISYGHTDENGEFRLFFPTPTNETQMQLLINPSDEPNTENPYYSTISFYNIQDESLTDYKLDFGEIELYNVENSVLLTIIVNENNNYQFLGCNLDGKVKHNYINLSPLYNEEHIYFHFTPQNLVAKNQIIMLKYYYKEILSDQIIENSVEIEISEAPVIYEIFP